MTRLHAFAPNGRRIVGTSDLVPALAEAEVFKEGPDAPLQLEFTGSSKLYWDGQYQTTEDDGRELYQDEDGDEWTEDAFVWLDPTAHDHDITIERMRNGALPEPSLAGLEGPLPFEGPVLAPDADALEVD